MFLIFNTANLATEIILADKNKICQVKTFSGKKAGEKLLILANRLLAAGRAKTAAIEGIGVVSGPGNFTGLRSGLASANALAYAWKIPVAGLKATEFKTRQELVDRLVKKLLKTKKSAIVLPFYGQAPNIT